MNRGSDKAKRVAIAIELDHPVPWHHGCYQGILAYADEHGWSCVVDPYLVGMTGQSGIGDYDGVVGRITADVAAAAQQHRIPVVNHWHNSPAKGLPLVSHDYREGGRLAGEHLVGNGFRRFAHLGVPGHRTTIESRLGMTRAVTAQGYAPPDELAFEHDYEATREGVIRFRGMMTDWLSARSEPVGVMVQNSPAARYVAQISSELGLRVPDDVGIVVHLADSIIVNSVSPTLTIVDSDYFGQGYESAAMLARLMDGKPLKPTHKVITPRRVIVRESSDVFLSPDPLVGEAMRFIAAHCRQTLRVEDVAEALNTSRRTLERRFVEVLGRSVYGEISRLRSEHIKRLLIETDRPLAVLAADCGFGSASHFTRFFRKDTGTTPSAFRKQYRQQAAAQAGL